MGSHMETHHLARAASDDEYVSLTERVMSFTAIAEELFHNCCGFLLKGFD